MSDTDIERMKNIGAKKELLNACSASLWQAKICCDEASKNCYKDALLQISEAQRYLQSAEEFCTAARKIKVKL